jgi:hypothetical protein
MAVWAHGVLGRAAPYQFGYQLRVTAAAQAALAFDRYARAHLDATGRASSQRALAQLVGEAQGNYSAAMRGVRGGTLDRVQRWLCAWSASGEPELVLVLGAGGATVVPSQEAARIAGVARVDAELPRLDVFP